MAGQAKAIAIDATPSRQQIKAYTSLPFCHSQNANTKNNRERMDPPASRSLAGDGSPTPVSSRQAR